MLLDYMMTMGGTIVPKYSYGCEICGREWFQWNSMSDSAVECPHCFSKKVNKLPVSFVIVHDDLDEKKSAKENVIDHIEENKTILKKIKEQSSEERVINND